MYNFDQLSSIWTKAFQELQDLNLKSLVQQHNEHQIPDLKDLQCMEWFHPEWFWMALHPVSNDTDPASLWYFQELLE